MSYEAAMAAKSKLSPELEERVVALASAGKKHAQIAKLLSKSGVKITPQAIGQFLARQAKATAATTRAKVREKTAASAVDAVDALNRSAAFGTRCLLPKLRRAMRHFSGEQLLAQRAIAETYAKYTDAVRKDVELLTKLAGADGPDPTLTKFAGLDDVLLALRRAPVAE